MEESTNFPFCPIFTLKPGRWNLKVSTFGRFCKGHDDITYVQYGNVKTDIRNKSKNEHVSAILHIKQAIKQQEGCVNFMPSKYMIKMAQDLTILYKNIDTPDEDDV